MRFNYIVHSSAWIWLGIFIAVPVTQSPGRPRLRHRPSHLTFHLRIAVQVASVTGVIYLTGWGPVLWGAYAFVALEVIAKCGLLGLAAGGHVEPPRNDRSASSASGRDGSRPGSRSPRRPRSPLMGAFVLFFVIRMAGATMEQKEEADGAVRLSEDRFRSLIQNSSDVTMIIDDDGIYRYLSPAVEQLLGYEPTGAGRPPGHRLRPPRRSGVLSVAGSMPSSRPRPDTAVLEFRMLRSDGTVRDVEAVISNQLDRPSVGGYVANVRDITERKKFEELLSHRALHDPLTGLANRQLILDRADQMLIRARRNGDPVAAFFVDLDNFKDANDSLGPRGRRPPPPGRGQPASSACSGRATPWDASAATSS